MDEIFIIYLQSWASPKNRHTAEGVDKFNCPITLRECTFGGSNSVSFDFASFSMEIMPRGYKTFSMFNSTENEISNAH